MFYLLATKGDGPYWRSGLEVLLYPTGCSFYRPFSYQKSWAVAKVVATPGGKDAKLDEGIVGFRFSKGDTNLLIPLRRVSHVVVGGDGDFHVRFTLGPYIQHAGQFLTVDLAENKDSLPGLADDKILLAVEEGQFKKKLAELPVTADMPDGIWKLISDHPQIGKDPVNPASFRTTFLRFLRARPLNSTDDLKPEPTAEKTPLAAHGFKLTVGTPYEIGVEYRTLKEKGAPDVLQQWDFHAQVDDHRMIISRPVLVRTGNYREEVLWIRPRIEEPGPCLLEWLPRRDEEDPKDAAPTQTLALRVPYITARPKLWKFMPGLLFPGGALAAMALLLFLMAILRTPRHGQDGWLAAITGLGAVLSPIATGILAFWFHQWHAMKR